MRFLRSIRRAILVTALGCLTWGCSEHDDGGDSGGGSGGNTAICEEVCPDVVAAQCPNGPPDQTECVKGCEAIRSGPCAPAHQTLLECAGTEPQFSCSASGAVVVTGCETENGALSNCLASSD
jgi:hypothetical protein